MPLMGTNFGELSHGVKLAGTKNVGIEDAVGERVLGCGSTD